MFPAKILFICKKNDCYGFVNYARRSSGLYNSTRFIVDGLRRQGIQAVIVEVADNNDIDRVVSKFQPKIVVIEALWVVPEKFSVLKRLHPRVNWFVHLHSHIPFLAMEGIAVKWLRGYQERHVGVIANSPEAYSALSVFLKRHLYFLPNIYLGRPRRAWLRQAKGDLHVGCFGAIRPLKNQLLQALAAIQFSREIGKDLKFHINSSRVETGGTPVLSNLIELFERTPGAELVEHSWHEPDKFVDLLQNEIDLGMQVSLTETFNVVTADYVTAGLPVVVSKEIDWVSRWNRCDDNSLESMVKVMHRVWRSRLLVKWNQFLLRKNSEKAQKVWALFTRCQ